MAQMIASDKKRMVLGLGVTGMACARFLKRRALPFEMVDSRTAPAAAEAFREEFPEVPLHLGEFDTHILCRASELWVSPGIPVDTPAIAAAAKAGVRIRGDIDVFAEEADAPVIAITGSNGKSTVTTLVGMMAAQSGYNVGVGGNLGTAALDLLDCGHDLYVLELSSFQLETTERLNAACAVLLNISEDHMDRYASKLEYLRAKQRIFRGAAIAVVNTEDALSQPLPTEGMKLVSYGLDGPDLKKFSVMQNHDGDVLVEGFEELIAVKDVALKGRHNISNALAALAIGRSMGFPVAAMREALKSFKGLPHRCQWVRQLDDVDYINDSKGTNVGASCVAIESFGNSSGKVVLIAGGDAKAADLTPLAAPMARCGRHALLLGKDAALLQDVLSPIVPCTIVESMEQAVKQAHDIAVAGDVVLLSPACASLDMFANYEQRGDQFIAEVQAL